MFGMVRLERVKPSATIIDFAEAKKALQMGKPVPSEPFADRTTAPNYIDAMARRRRPSLLSIKPDGAA